MKKWSDRVPEWLRSDSRAFVVGTLSGLVATVFGVIWAFNLSLKAEFDQLRQQREEEHISQVRRDSTLSEAFVAQLLLNRQLLTENRDSLTAELSRGPRSYDYVLLSTIPDLTERYGPSSLPITILADSTLREAAFLIGNAGRRLNDDVISRNAFAVGPLHNGMVYEGQRLTDPGPSELQLGRTDKGLLETHRSLIKRIDGFVARFRGNAR